MELPSQIYTLISKAFQRPRVKRSTVIITLALVAIFASAIIMRIYPAKYGFYIHEFDPYFDYYATDYIVQSFNEKGILGMLDYFSWTDNMTWFPNGREVAATSQVGLQFTGAILYIIATSIFGLVISLYDFIVLFPVFIGAFTTIAMYLLVKRISSASAGLLAALVIAFSPPIIQRGALGWYKSEPLALFLVILGSYFFLTIYDEKTSRIGLVLRASVSGILLGIANTAWGGSMYFTAVFGALLFLTPFLKVDLRRTVYLGSVFVAFTLIFSAIFPRPGPAIISGPAGLAMLGGLLFAVIAYGIKNTVDSRVYFRSLVKAAFVFALIAMVIVSMGAVSSLSGRYQTVLDPFLRSIDPLVESVAEHQTPTGADYLSSYFALLFIAGFGAVMMVRRRSIAAGYTLILALSAIYVSASFARLMIYSSIAFAMLAGIGLHELTSAIVRPPTVSSVKKKFRLPETRSEVKFAYGIFMIAIISFPVAAPTGINWLETADVPVSIASSTTNFRANIPDWREALSWMRYSTPPFQPDGKQTVFAAWWDYGYWIAVMGNRTSLADNATINSTRISQLGRMFMSEESQSMEILRQLKADYVVIYVVGQAFTQSGQQFLLLGTSGDESKKQWFIRIGGLDENLFLEEDAFTPTPYFWENTFLGKMMPFSFVGYAEFGEQGLQFSEKTEYERGLRSLYTYDLKYPEDGPGPLRLAFMSSSLAEHQDGIFSGVIVYEIVK
jgi:dolichyl-diphosphooligosaccharide--protein glycosyltransferase